MIYENTEGKKCTNEKVKLKLGPIKLGEFGSADYSGSILKIPKEMQMR